MSKRVDRTKWRAVRYLGRWYVARLRTDLNEIRFYGRSQVHSDRLGRFLTYRTRQLAARKAGQLQEASKGAIPPK